MSKDNKRRDSKGRVLRTGEQQRSNGQYLYTYKGRDGKNKFVYSWKLEPTDKQPEGKRSGKSLRELEKEIEKSLNEELAYQGGDVTVSELVGRYIATKTGVRHNTLAGVDHQIICTYFCQIILTQFCHIPLVHAY